MVFAQLDDECVAMRQVVARFAEEHIAPYAASWDEAGHFPRELVKPLAELGLVELTVPQALGGTEASRLASAVVYEALAHADLSPVVWLAVHNMVAGIIATCGTDAQRARYLPGIVAGDILCAFSLSEAEAGSDVRGMRATARREGDTHLSPAR